MGNPLAIVADEYDLSLSEVYGATAYYYDHKAEIDQSMAESDAFVETMQNQASSPLQEKLGDSQNKEYRATRKLGG
jgi:hypothetical protein